MIIRATLPVALALTPLDTARRSFELLQKESNNNRCMRKAFQNLRESLCEEMTEDTQARVGSYLMMFLVGLRDVKLSSSKIT